MLTGIKHKAVLILGFVLLVLVMACGGGTPESTPAAPPDIEAMAKDFQLSACRFTVPDDAKVICGYLHVPEDRSNPNSPTISLHVAIFNSESPTPAPDPIVYLEGGPGVHALELLPLTYEDRIVPFLSKRDFVIFDQRGVGYSKPNLQCPELIALTYEVLNQRLSLEERGEKQALAATACRERLLVNGADLRAYTSAENAADLAVLRAALGIEQWNLYGTSYGTRLALTTMRDYPVGIRSVVLDSAYPLQVNLLESLLPNADRAFTRLFEDCESDKDCGRAYPKLESDFYDLVDRLDANPVSIKASHPLTGDNFDVLLDGDTLVDTLFQSLYATELIPVLPNIIVATRTGAYGLIGRLVGALLWQSEYVSHGMYFSVGCGEETPFNSPDKIASVNEAYPRLGKHFDIDTIFAVCDSWGAKEADPIENLAVSSRIPTLVLAGEYDPITPPLWGRMVAESLNASFFYEFSGMGHGVSTSGECPLSITLAFLDDPTVEPDTSCISTMSR